MRRTTQLGILFYMFGLAGQVIGFIAKDIVWNTVYFPIWWYTRGILRILGLMKHQVQSLAHTLHLPTLFKYLFKPMYGYTDIISRIISFYVRIAQLILLLCVTLIVVLGLLILLVIWIVAPVFVLYGIGFHLGWIQFNLYTLIAWNLGLPL